MRNVLACLAIALCFALPAAAQNSCALGMTFSCDSNNHCSATVTNNGTGTCSGDFLPFIAVTHGFSATTNNAIVSNFQQSLGLPSAQCFTNATFPVPGIFTFGLAVCFGPASLGPGGSFTMSADVALNGAPATDILAVAEVIDSVSSQVIALTYQFNLAAAPVTCQPTAAVISEVDSGTPYTLQWSPVLNSAATFTVKESVCPSSAPSTCDPTTFASPATVSTIPCDPNNQTNPCDPVKLTMQFNHTVTANTEYAYQVAANSCTGATLLPSAPVTTVVSAAAATNIGHGADGNVPFGSTTPLLFNFFIPGSSGKQALDVPFTASVDKPFLSVSPSSGTIPPAGTTVTVTASPTGLPPGANTGTLHVTSNGVTNNSTVSISLTTPVSPGTKTLPPANSLIIPVVAHAPGALGPFQSDVRLVNANTSSVNYQLTYTPTQTDGTTTGKATTIAVDAGQSIALNDILKDFFGVGLLGDSSYGALELRPLNSSTTLNYASSRTYTFNPNGTYGQFMTAIRFSDFATKVQLVPVPGAPPPSTPVLSLQQISQAGPGPLTGFRSNVGLLEGSGTPASGHITLFDDSHNQIATTAYTLLPGEHVQKSLIAWFPSAPLPISDGRIEVTSEGTTGAVTAYASVLDNITNCPVAIAPVQASQISATQFILPGMAALGGTNNFHSDVRLYNGGTAAVTLNATYYPQNNGTPVHGNAPIVIPAGQVASFNDIIAGPLFNAPGNGGSVVFTSAAPASVVATGRTYTIAANTGTFGQGIPGVTPSQGIGMGDRPMQILQLEESPNFRSNVGFAELTGNPVTVHVTATIPDSKVAASVDIPLQAYQFYQPRLLAQIYPGQAIYNARISVQVTSGTGRVAAYASVIDNGTNSGAYVPSQK